MYRVAVIEDEEESYESIKKCFDMTEEGTPTSSFDPGLFLSEGETPPGTPLSSGICSGDFADSRSFCNLAT